MTPVDALAATQPAEVDPIAARIATLRTLRDGWLDGEGAAPSEPALAQAAHLARIVAVLGETPRIFPQPDGGATVECKTVDIYVGADGRITSTTEGP